MQADYDGQSKEQEFQSQHKEMKSQLLWKYQSRKKSNQSVLKHFQISVSNKYSCLEIDGMDELKVDEPNHNEKQQWKIEIDGIDEPKSDEPNYKEIHQWKIVKSKHNKHTKDERKNFETRNKFEVFGIFTEHEIDLKLGGQIKNEDEKSKKMKCRTCGYKKSCHLQCACKAQDMHCYACLKPNHFPKSLNCKVKRKKNRMSSNPIFGCLN